jgi:HSP20 family protein
MARDLAGWIRSIVAPAVEALQDASWRPPTDIYRTPEGWLIKLELAGVRPEDVRATVTGRRLRVQGVRRDSRLGEGCRCYRLEIAYSRFERDIELPVELDTTHVEAEHRDGMLLIRLISGD